MNDEFDLNDQLEEDIENPTDDEEFEDIDIISNLIKEKPDILVIKIEDGLIIDIDTIIYENNQIVSILDKSGNTYTKDDVEIVDKFLYVPAIKGYVYPGVILGFSDVLKYTLKFGIHLNTSNQVLDTWYLDDELTHHFPRPVPEGYEHSPWFEDPNRCKHYKTLYPNMIPNVTFVSYLD